MARLANLQRAAESARADVGVDGGRFGGRPARVLMTWGAVTAAALTVGMASAQAASYGPQTTLASSLQPTAVGLDSAGDVFVATTSAGGSCGEYCAQSLFEFPAGGGPETSRLWEGAVDSPAGEIAVDGQGNIYYSDSAGLVQEITPLQELPSGNNPYSAPVTVNIGNDPNFEAGGVAIDAAGDLFASDLNQGGAIWEVPAGGGASQLVDSGAGAQALAVDAAGDLFWTKYNGNQVWELPAGANPGQEIQLASGYKFGDPQGLAVDRSGDVFVADSSNAQVVELPASGGHPGAGTPVTIGKGFTQPVDVAVDGNGDVFVADLGTIGSSSGQVVEIPVSQTQATTTALSSSVSPSIVGQPVTFTVTVSGPAGSTQTPGGTVTLSDGHTTLGTVPLDGTGKATYTTSSLAAGTHQISAVYGGDSADSGSTSPTLTQTVNPDTVTALAALTGQYVQGSPAFKALSPKAQQLATALINAATQFLGQISPKLSAKQTAQLISGYDLALGSLQNSGYLTAAQVATLKAIAAGI